MGSRGRVIDNLNQTPQWVQSPTQGSVSWPWHHDLSQNQELDTQATLPPRHPRSTSLVHQLTSHIRVSGPSLCVWADQNAKRTLWKPMITHKTSLNTLLPITVYRSYMWLDIWIKWMFSCLHLDYDFLSCCSGHLFYSTYYASFEER